MKKIFWISFLAFFVILIPTLSNATLCDTQQVTGPQNLLTQSSSENKIEIMIQVGIYEIDLSNLSAEVDIVLTVQFPYERESDDLDVWIAGGGDASISCTLLERDNTKTSYTGTHSRTHWLIGGNPELYPFESYHINFPIFPSTSQWEFDFGFIFGERSSASFQGDKRRALTEIFKTENESNIVQVSFKNYPLSTVGLEGQYQEYYPMLRVHIEREERFGTLILSPVFFAYAFLVFSFMIKVPESPKRKRDLGGSLRNRLTIYLVLFTFSIGFFFSIGSISPYSFVLSLAEVLVLNLSICVSLSGIFSIVSSTTFKNLNLAALISCVVSTYFVLWSPFLGNMTMPVLIVLLIPMLIFLIASAVSMLLWLHRAEFKVVKNELMKGLRRIGRKLKRKRG